MFNEQNLRADIVDKWGPAGAHVDVFDELLRRYEELRALITAWADAADLCDERHTDKAWVCFTDSVRELRKAVGR